LNDVVELHPELDDVALATLPRKAVTRALGMEPTVRASVRSLRVLVGDRYLLCSDGLTSEIGHSVLREMLAQSNKPAEMVADLVRSAKEAGGRDNVTALVIDCQAAPEEQRYRKPSPPPLPRKNPLAHPSPMEGDAEKGARAADPEIVLIRTKPDEADEPRISVVPTAKADENMIRALDRIAGAFASATVRCSECETPFDKSHVFCPRCGYAATEPPLSRKDA
jgi:hypothetical protein